MSFLKELNFAKVLIVLCIAASVWLGWRAWNEHQEIGELRAALQKDGKTERLVREVQGLSKQHTNLYRQLDTEKLQGETDPLTYIRRIATRDNIELGQLDIATRERGTTVRGVIDSTYRITPKDKSTQFDKVQIANFLWTLEDQSHRVRVTDVKIGTKDRVAPHEYPLDLWTLDCTITSRQKEE